MDDEQFMTAIEAQPGFWMALDFGFAQIFFLIKMQMCGNYEQPVCSAIRFA